MLRTLWFAVKVGFLITAAVWLADRPGVLEFDWMEYHIQLGVGTALVILLFTLLAVLLAYRFFLNITYLPRWFKRHRREYRRRKGSRAITLGLTAIAAGDVKVANYQAHRARRFLPSDQGLTVLLEAQAARLQGRDEEARQALYQLLENKDTAFLGLRGLLTDAMERGALDEAEDLAQRALEMHPKQPWVLHIAYDVELRRKNWSRARSLLERAERQKALPAEKAQSDHIALLLKEAEYDKKSGRERAALKKLKEAYKRDPASVQAAERLARYYLDKGQDRSARKLLQQSWKLTPHPELAALWREAASKKQKRIPANMMGWVEKLVALRPDAVESQIAAAEEAVHQGLWGIAEQYLSMAETIRPSARIYRLKARLEDLRGHPETAKRLLEEAGNAPPNKVWTCIETGRIYESWSPVAEPHGSFNTIIWGYPHERRPDKAIGDRTQLLITAPQPRR